MSPLIVYADLARALTNAMHEKIVTTIPTLRRVESEEYYQYAKQNGIAGPLRDEPVVQEFNHWALIANRFPYDAVFTQHDMLIPKRDFAYAREMNRRESKELRDILDGPIGAVYHLFFENTVARRSNLTLYHLHLAKFYSSREEFGI